MTVLSVRNLTVALPSGGDRPEAITDVSFDVSPGEVLCIVGESGSGKSVSAFALMGLLPRRLPITSGHVLLEGRDVVGMTADERRSIRGRRAAMIFQEPMTALNPVMPIGRQIAEVFEAHGVGDAPTRRSRALSLLEAVKLPDPKPLLDTYPFRLSGGQRQRVMIAMALALDPALLIADEPTTALDVTTQAQILKQIRDLQKAKGTGVLFITHDFGVVADLADRVAVMEKGRIVEIGTRDAVLNTPQHPYTRRLIAAVPRLSVRSDHGNRAPPILDIVGLTKAYGRGPLFGRRSELKAVDDCSLSIAKGETVGIVGESGSGKSTLARCVVRLYQPTAGTIRFDGQDITRLSGSALKSYRKRIQMVFQDPFASLNPRRRVGEIIAEGPITHGVDRRVALARARKLLDLVGLDPACVDRYPHEFSGGQRQRIGLARALALEPDLLVADEPVSALDVSVQAQVLDLMADLRKRLGLTMLFITHDLRVAAQICDRIAVMRRGVILELGTAVEVFERPRHEYTRALIAAIPGRGWEAARGQGEEPPATLVGASPRRHPFIPAGIAADGSSFGAG